MDSGIIKIKKYNIPYFIIDNKAKDTLLCVHGFNSSREFIGKINEKKLNFNLISISLPGSKDVESDDISLSFLSGVVDLATKKVKNSNLHLLGHSLGGALVSMQKENKKINSFFFVSPYHPLISESRVVSLFRDFLNPDTPIKKAKKIAVRSAFWALNKINYINNESFIEESKWLDIARNELFNEEYLEKIDKNFKSLLKKSKFIVGENDPVISTKLLKKYVESLDKAIKVVEGDHNPFKTNLDEVVNWLNESFVYKKRYLAKLRKIV